MKANFPKASLPGVASTCEIDSHADTCCMGRNFVPLYFTEEVVDVTPFTDRYTALRDVPVAGGATHIQLDDGSEYILVVHQGLWFGEELDVSLLNPYQLRAHGVHVWDNPCDTRHPLSLYDPQLSLRIPMEMVGTFCSFSTRVPTQEELDSLPRVSLTSDATWDPSQATFQLQETEEEEEVDQEAVRSSVVATYKKARQVAASMFSESDRLLRVVSSTLSEAFYDEALGVCTTATLDRSLRSGFKATRGVKAVKKSSDPSSVKYRAKDFSETRHSTYSKEDLMKHFRLNEKAAEKTLKSTTRRGTRCAKNPIARRYKSPLNPSKYRRCGGTWYTDTFFPEEKSLSGSKCCQIFYNRHYYFIYPMESKSADNIEEAVLEFARSIGLPDWLVSDGAPEIAGKRTGVQRFLRRNNVKWRATERDKQSLNKAEEGIRILKSRTKRLMVHRDVPKRLWDFAYKYETEILNRVWQPKLQQTPEEEVFGETPNISEYLDFGFYDWVWYWNVSDKTARVGRWLGVSKNKGEHLSYWILPISGLPIVSSTVQSITQEEMRDPSVYNLLADFDEKVKQKFLVKDLKVDLTGVPDWSLLDDELTASVIDNVEIMEADDADVATFDKLVGAGVSIVRGGERMKGVVKSRALDEYGNLKGKSNPNPLLDTSEYYVEFEDGSNDHFTANIIAENVFSQVDEEGREHLLVEEIVGHRKTDAALTRENCWMPSRNGQQRMRRTTKGWMFLVQWKDGSSNWIPLKDLKDSNPIETAEYAVAHGIAEEPAFAWWAKEILKKRRRILSKLGKSKYWRTTEKFGIKVPKTVEEAQRFDRENGNTLWMDAIKKEMKHVMPAFTRAECSLEEAKSGKGLPGYQEIKCHLVFDIKMDFTRKARFVAGGHMTDPPASMTYSSVVSRETVRIALLLAALNDLDVCAADIGNAYLNAPCKEQIWVTAGPEFGENAGKPMIIERALYGLKSSGAAWRQMLSNSIKKMGFTSSKGDPDLYFKPQVKPDGTKYYEYLLVYVDDILCISHDTKSIMDELAAQYRLKEGSVGPPERYLGADTKFTQAKSGLECWAMSSDSYVREAVKVVEQFFEEDGKKWKKPMTPFPRLNYQPELDSSPLLEPELISRYQQMIGILRWSCELGRLDILLEVSLLSAFSAAPREGHLEAVYHMFAYLRKHSSAAISFDPTMPDFGVEFSHYDCWEEFYDPEPECVPKDAPEPRGEAVHMSCFVDASHASNKVTYRSHTGIFIMLNSAPIVWYSKRQNTVETSTFGSEFVALRIATELVQGLRYKLRMMGVPLEGPTSMYCDNESVTKNASVPESTLSKKHNAICFHKVRESVAAGWIQVGWIKSEKNLADLFTKVLSNPRRQELLKHMLSRWSK